MILWEDVYKAQAYWKRKKMLEQLEFESIVKPIDDEYTKKLRLIQQRKTMYRRYQKCKDPETKKRIAAYYYQLRNMCKGK